MNEKSIESYFHLRLPELESPSLGMRRETTHLSRMTEQYIYSQIDSGNIQPCDILEKYRMLYPLFQTIYRKKFYGRLISNFYF